MNNQDPATVSNPLAGVNFDAVLDSPNLVCECGCCTFHPTYVVKKVSMLLTQSGKNEYVPMDVFVCDKCGKVMTDLMPKAVADKLIQTEGTKAPVITNEEVK